MDRDTTLCDAFENLVLFASRGNQDAQTQLLKNYWPIIRQAVRARKSKIPKRIASQEETQDIEQAVAIKVLEGLPKHSWQGGSAFCAWIKTLADHEVIDAFRKKAAQKRSDDLKDTFSESNVMRQSTRSPETRVDDQRHIQALWDRVCGLKPEYATAVLLHHLGYTHAQIGDALDCSGEAARKLVSRGHAQLVDNS